MNKIDMKSSKEDTGRALIIISVPFQRLIRAYLSDFLLNALKHHGDVLLVTPFADNYHFRHSNKRSYITHISVPCLVNLRFFNQALYHCTTVLRMRGYWFRQRFKIPYYWATRNVNFSRNKNVIRYRLLVKLALDLCALIGSFRKIWKLFDNLHGYSTYACPKLIDYTEKYRKIICIQAANWGYQDALLAYWIRRCKWKSILLPYSTDQLFSNGWMYCEYDRVFAQGNMEYEWASGLHSIPSKRISKYGSLYLRSLKSYKKIKSNTTDTITICYAGLAQEYFPKSEEIGAVRMLCETLPLLLKRRVVIIYRPVLSLLPGNNEYDDLHSMDNLIIKPAGKVFIGLDRYDHEDTSSQVESIAQDLDRSELVVMSLSSSIAIEAAFFGAAVVSFAPIDNPFLAERRVDLLIESNRLNNGLSACPIAYTQRDLLALIKWLILDTTAQTKIVNRLLADWDCSTSHDDLIFTGLKDL